MRPLLAPLLLLAAGCSFETYVPAPMPAVGSDTGAADTGGGGDGGGDGADGGGGGVPCSVEGGGSATLQLVNRTGAGIRVFWSDWSCEELLYHELPPGQSATQGTYVGHAWVARDLSGALVDTLVVDAPTQTWEVQ